jgi:hypothetical protein
MIMAGRGMGCAVRGGGAVGSGPANKMIDEPSTKVKPVMLKKGGMAKKMMGVGMVKGYRKGGMCD